MRNVIIGKILELMDTLAPPSNKYDDTFLELNIRPLIPAGFMYQILQEDACVQEPVHGLILTVRYPEKWVGLMFCENLIGIRNRNVFTPHEIDLKFLPVPMLKEILADLREIANSRIS